VDQDAGFLFVACSTQAEVLDAEHNGKKLSSIDTGDGVDDLNYSPATHTLYVGAAKDARLTVARVDAAGKLSLMAQVPTHEGARNGVVTKVHDLPRALTTRSIGRANRGIAEEKIVSPALCAALLRAVGEPKCVGGTGYGYIDNIRLAEKKPAVVVARYESGVEGVRLPTTTSSSNQPKPDLLRVPWGPRPNLSGLA